MAQYLRKHQISWPVIVDADRSFEVASNVGEISLKNIWQARVLTSDGEFIRANASDLDSAAKRALAGAKWNVDPKKMPSELQATWMHVEFGSFSDASVCLKRFGRSNKPEVKEAVGLLKDYVQQQMDSQLQMAEEANKAGESWEAFQMLSTLETRFKGFDLPASISVDVKHLQRTAEVKNELAAVTRLEQARKVGSSRSPSAQKRALAMLQQITEDFAGTEAAKAASKILAGR